MKKGNKNSKYFTGKTYFYALSTIIVLLLIIWYAVSWYQVKEEEKYLNSYLISSNTIDLEIKDLNEISQVLKESSKDYFIFITYTGNEKTYKLERSLKNTIDNYNLKDSFYYLNITDLKDDENLISKLNDTLNTTKIKTVPCLLYYENSSIEEIIQVKNDIFTNKDFVNLLNNYEYEKIG